LGTGPVVVWLTVCVWVILHCAPRYQTRYFPSSVLLVGQAPDPTGESLSSRRSWNVKFSTPSLVIVTKGKNCSAPKLCSGHSAELPRMLLVFRPQSRFVGVSERSVVTRVGPVQVIPPSVDL